METTTQMMSTLTAHFIPSRPTFVQPEIARFGFKSARFGLSLKVSLFCGASQGEGSCSSGGRQRQISSVESFFCYDKAIPEQIIERPVGLSIAEKDVGDQPRCTDCQAKGAVLCSTCGGSGLYVDSIMESQGIIVKVRCLGKISLHPFEIWNFHVMMVAEEQEISCALNVVGEVIYNLFSTGSQFDRIICSM
ncbi:hypothetical protein Cgig2_034141 [Carnegiea gigantea]|uniref:Uncharacterized protein n=1 Tax=Carnegiea gigantea TaxID=171969 RepID=A0A9Q1JF06_9CARY|nr:hypothetical protein Cgig2_034141 [Carnegiea gigantea]